MNLQEQDQQPQTREYRTRTVLCYRNCLRCGIEFPVTSRSRNAVYCCFKCTKRVPVIINPSVDDIRDGVRRIQLTRDQIAIVDDHKYESLNKWLWHAEWVKTSRQFRAVRNSTPSEALIHGQKITILMARAVADVVDAGVLVDHHNGFMLDNRRHNLRVSSHHQNACNRGRQVNNTSGFKGVTWHARASKWMAQIESSGARTYLGLFTDPKDAWAAYREAAILLHGEFAHY